MTRRSRILFCWVSLLGVSALIEATASAGDVMGRVVVVTEDGIEAKASGDASALRAGDVGVVFDPSDERIAKVEVTAVRDGRVRARLANPPQRPLTIGLLVLFEADGAAQPAATEKPTPAAPSGPPPASDTAKLPAENGLAWLGVVISDVTEDFRREHDFPNRQAGAVVNSVDEGSPAAAGGLRPNDVIQKFAGEALTGYEQLPAAMSKQRPGQQVQLRVWRAGKSLDVTATPVDQLAFYRQLCDGGDARGYTGLGAIYAYGRGVAKDMARAAAFYEQACDMGNPAGCSFGGWMYVNGSGVPTDEAKGVALLKKGCSAGNEWGCDKLGAMGQQP